MEELWEQSWIDRYNTILQSADTIQYVCENPGRKAFLARDRWMVDNSSMLIGVFNNKPGGTEHTIDYAKKKELKIKVITDEL